MATSFIRSVEGRIAEAESRAFVLTSQRNRIVNSPEWESAILDSTLCADHAAYDRIAAQLDALDKRIDKADHDRATWLALLNNTTTRKAA